MKNNIGENLKLIRKQKNLTIEELSKRASVGRTTISEIERGKSKSVRSETIIGICEVLEVTPNDIFGVDNKKNNSLIELKRIKFQLEDLLENVNKLIEKEK